MACLVPSYSPLVSFKSWTKAGNTLLRQSTRRVLPINLSAPSSQSRTLSLFDPSSPRPSISAHNPSEIRFSAGQPEDLPTRLLELSAWELGPSKSAITRQFTFRTFNDAWRFMSVVADECKAKRHHPSWSNLYNQVSIEWTTHKPQGLSIKDVDMAAFCDRAADEIGLKMP
ncbi:unnamed protein product [Periconia digitata]|uniref:4a-hydroxytetrahydrobiopterin dehydratase n=1 Tax=Periconia digitata TaxID=1303443 RepID=A0A9W4UR94_9PLEO|nr:unnamed protein product [Periconia digitata]